MAQSVVADWRRIGDPRLAASALNDLSWDALRLERYDEARGAGRERFAQCINRQSLPAGFCL